MIVSGTILDEGASMSILSLTTWKALGSPPIVPITLNLLALNRGTSQPLGIWRFQRHILLLSLARPL